MLNHEYTSRAQSLMVVPDAPATLGIFILFWVIASAALFVLSLGIIEFTSEITETEQVRPRWRLLLATAGGFAVVWYGLSQVYTIPSQLQSVWVSGVVYPVATALLSVLLSIFSYDVFRHWARRSKSHTRGFVLTLGVIIVPVLIFAYGALVLVQRTGVDLNQLLFTSGVLGIVLGLALQDTLSSVFARYALLADESIVEGDMIVLDDGRICRIDYIGYRTTKMYYVKEHSIVYVPNSNLASQTITNISRPSISLRVTLPVGISYAPTTDINDVSEKMEVIARENPHILVRIDQKITLITNELGHKNEELRNAKDPATAARLKQEVSRYESLLKRLNLESELDTFIDKFCTELTDEREGTILYRLVKREHGLFRPSNKPIKEELKKTLGSGRRKQKIHGELERMMEAWVNFKDPWAWEEDYKNEHFVRSKRRAADLYELKRDAFLDSMSEGNAEEVREKCLSLARYLREDYKPKVTSEQNPMARFVEFDASSVDLTLDFYVDDIRLNRYWRREIVVREIATELKRRFDKLGIEIPFPQTDLHFRDELKATFRGLGSDSASHEDGDKIGT